MITFKEIRAAHEKLRSEACLLPCAYFKTIHQVTNNRIFFKLDNLQMTGSFKERSTLNRLLDLSNEKAKRGVIA